MKDEIDVAEIRKDAHHNWQTSSPAGSGEGELKAHALMDESNTK
jgi:hypothetical protein